jgi:hypothetical protein
MADRWSWLLAAACQAKCHGFHAKSAAHLTGMTQPIKALAVQRGTVHIVHNAVDTGFLTSIIWLFQLLANQSKYLTCFVAILNAKLIDMLCVGCAVARTGAMDIVSSCFVCDPRQAEIPHQQPNNKRSPC